MSRDHVVSVRLTDEQARAARRAPGGAGAWLRRLVRRELSGPLPVGRSVAWQAPWVVADAGPGVVWSDGTVGQTWPTR